MIYSQRLSLSPAQTIIERPCKQKEKDRQTREAEREKESERGREGEGGRVKRKREVQLSKIQISWCLSDWVYQ